MVVRILLAAACFTLTGSVSAQQATPAPVRPAIASHGCTKPPDSPPGRLNLDNRLRNRVKEINDYLACLKKFAMDHQATAQTLFDQAKPHVDAANAAIDEHNKAVAQFKEEQDKTN